MAAPAPVQTAIVVSPQPVIIKPYVPDAPRENVRAALPVKTPAERRGSLAGAAPSIQTNISNMLEATGGMHILEKKVIVSRGDTLMDLLVKKAFIPSNEAYQAIQALRNVYDPRELSPGHKITVFFHNDPSIDADPKFSGVRIEKDIINAVTVSRDDEGRYTADKAEKGIHHTLKGFKGVIENSLYVDARAGGVPDSVILDLIKMYSWNVDFQREIHTGDRFEVMYEEYRTDDGKAVPGKGDIIYARLSLGGNDMPFYRYQDGNGEADYYDNNGMSAKKTLMRTPVDGARLSSGFGRRRHPILGYSKMHEGLDFAAPRGTPVYAAGDGTIKRIGPFSAYGNYIRIHHRAGLETAYAHMKGFKSGLRRGARVKQGQVIGYVGSTGRSTGPHLHYEIILNNAQVNPASVRLPTGKALKAKDMNTFRGVVAQTREQFNSFHITVVANGSQPEADVIARN
ncbi:MAG: peptidoglycan DD-metalloendopeptidase family protein [Pseudomonadota bacterium]